MSKNSPTIAKLKNSTMWTAHFHGLTHKGKTAKTAYAGLFKKIASILDTEAHVINSLRAESALLRTEVGKLAASLEAEQKGRVAIQNEAKSTSERMSVEIRNLRHRDRQINDEIEHVNALRGENARLTGRVADVERKLGELA